MCKRRVLFGAGHGAERIISFSSNKVVAIIDNNKSGFFHGVPIISFDEYLRDYRDITIQIASTKYSNVIEKQLISKGIANYEIPLEIFKDSMVSHDDDISHENWADYLSGLYNKPGMKVLEIGSRCVTGTILREKFNKADYVGFDYYPGNNVDVVGDVHQLGKYFDQKFDLIYSSAVFEHLAMPWIASLEMIKLLKLGGNVFVESHYSFSSHERPWHFFQYSENALNVLFPEIFGIKCKKKGCSNLIKGKFSEESAEYLRGRLVDGLYCHSEFLGEKITEVSNDKLDWRKITLEDVANGTKYPEPDSDTSTI